MGCNQTATHKKLKLYKWAKFSLIAYPSLFSHGLKVKWVSSYDNGLICRARHTASPPPRSSGKDRSVAS